MELKIKISGWNCYKQRIKSFDTIIETPDFSEKQFSFEGHDFTKTIIEQQIEWIDENYKSAIVPLAEKQDLFPIHGYSVVYERPMIDKKELIVQYANEILKDWSDENKALFFGALLTQWKDIKGLSIERIFKICFNTCDVSQTTAKFYLNRISDILKVENKLESKT